MKQFLLCCLAAPLTLFRRKNLLGHTPRILVIRRQKMGDLLCTVPLFHALKKAFPGSFLAVACDLPGASVCLACRAVDEVIILRKGWNRWLDVLMHAAQLQDFDIVLTAKGGFDRRLALLTRLTNAPVRVGLARATAQGSPYYTKTVLLPKDGKVEHQVETQMRLLSSFDINLDQLDFSLVLPERFRAQAEQRLKELPFVSQPEFILLNLSSNRSVAFSMEDFSHLCRFCLKHPLVSIGVVGLAAEKEKLEKFVQNFASDRVVLLETADPLILAAYLEKTRLFVTAEGGAAHLAAATQTPALVFWSEGPLQKWRSRSDRHFILQKEAEEKTIPLHRVLDTIEKNHLIS